MFDELLNIADQATAENDLPPYCTAAPRCYNDTAGSLSQLLIEQEGFGMHG